MLRPGPMILGGVLLIGSALLAHACDAEQPSVGGAPLAASTVAPPSSREAVRPDATRPDPVLARGLRHTTDGREIAESAIARTNRIAAPKGVRLRPSWSVPDVGGADDAIVVHLVQAPPDASSTPAAVPRDCTCVFVNPALLQAWIAQHSRSSAQLELDPSYLLTFMLLHELGHLESKAPSAEFANGELAPLNIDPTRAKANEERADEFAAALIRNALHATPVSSASMDASWVATELSKLSWNMQAYRSLDEFGAAATGSRAVFYDQSYSHPNLAWRVLRSNDLIQNTPETRQLLESFEALRRH